MRRDAQPRRRPELLLAAAALLICAGVLVVTGAGRGKDAATDITMGQNAANPFEQGEQSAQSSAADAAGSYIIGYTGVVIYPPPGAETADTTEQTVTEPPVEYAQPPATTAPKATAAPQVPPAPLQAVNINTANQAQLETLPGIGPVKAQAILEWRAANGYFSNANQLLEVKGIGEKTLANLLPYIVI